MTLQWTVVAVFLYVEIAFLILLLLPWIRPKMWNKVFGSRLARALEAYSHVYAWAGAGILILLFFDAIREVRKYTSADIALESTLHTPNSDAVIHMRLFRAQRNLYISGFALFLYIVIRRMIQLIKHEAQLMASAEAAMKQAQSASAAASAAMDNGAAKDEILKLKEQLKEAREQKAKAETDCKAMKEQSVNLQREYDRLCDEYNKLEKNSSIKKDD